MSGIISVLLAILLLGILVAIHEAGHFWAARLTGIEVREFAIGIGPAIVSWQSKKTGTKYALRWIPLGGYCSFYGEDDVSGSEQEDPRAFPKQKVWKRMLTVLMGPVMNFVLAFVVMIFFYWVIGVGVYDPYVSEVSEGRPAQEAGILAGDIILSVNGADARGNATALHDVVMAWQPGDGPLTLRLERRTDHGPEYADITVTPTPDPADGVCRIGVGTGGYLRQRWNGNAWVADMQPATLLQAVASSWGICSYASGVIFSALKDLVTTGQGFEETGGPVAVVSVVSQQVQKHGMEQFFWMLCMISINLGIMNLLPIPGLDGSRFLFMVYEAIRGKPVPQRKEAMVHAIGMVLLLGLMLFFTFRDVMNLFK